MLQYLKVYFLKGFNSVGKSVRTGIVVQQQTLSDSSPLHWPQIAGFNSSHCSEHCSLFNQSLGNVPETVNINFPAVECVLNFLLVGE